MASKKKRGLSQAEARRRAREREKEAARKKAAREKERLRKEKLKAKEKQRKDLQRAREAQRAAKKRRSEAMRRKIHQAQKQRLIDQADAKLQAALDHLRKLEVQYGVKKRTRQIVATGEGRDLPRQPTRQQESYVYSYEAEHDGRASIVTRHEHGAATIAAMYRDYLARGDIKAPLEGTNYDLDTSKKGAIQEYHVPVQELLTDSGALDALNKARAAVREAQAWGKKVYAVVHMYQSEPTYSKSTEKGQAGGKPDGWLKEDPDDKSKRLWSTWQGIPATDPADVLTVLDARLNQIMAASGKDTTSIIHEIIIRSVVTDNSQDDEQ